MNRSCESDFFRELIELVYKTGLNDSLARALLESELTRWIDSFEHVRLVAVFQVNMHGPMSESFGVNQGFD